MMHMIKGKFQAKWVETFVVEFVYSSGAYRLTNAHGDTIMMPINGKFLNKILPFTIFSRNP